MRTSRIICTTLVLLLFVQNSYARDQHVRLTARNAKKIDALVSEMMTQKKIPGISLAISFPDYSIHTKGYGHANLEYGKPVRKGSIFSIGSVTKTFTAIGIMLLEERGSLSVNDTLAEYLPDFPRGGEITIRNLLQHTSGIKSITEVEPFAGNEEKDWTPQEVVEMLEPLPLDFEPGTDAHYSNSGAILLGIIIEEVSGMNYADFIRENIAEPLGMTNTLLGSNKEIVPNRVSGYDVVDGAVCNASYASLTAPFASGGMMSTAADVVKLHRGFQSPGTILNQNSIDAMLTRIQSADGNENYGYCLEMIRHRGTYYPCKTGAISGFNAFFVYFPDLKMSVAVTSNLNDSLNEICTLSVLISDMFRD